MILCSNCGQQIKADQNYCMECGSPSSATGPGPEAAPDAPRQATSHGARQSLALLIAFGLIAVVAVSVAVMMAAKNRDRPSAQNDRPPAQSVSVTTSMPPNRKPSLRITATASSIRAPIKDIYYEARNVLDGNWRTGWVEGGSGPGLGEWIQCDFDREVTLQRITVTPGYFKSSKLWAENNRLSAATFYFSDNSSRKFHFPDRMEEQKLEVGNVRTSWVRMVLNEIYPGSVYPDDTPISDMSFDWVD